VGGYQGLDGWLIGKDDGARIQWDGTDSQTGGAYIDIIPDNLRLHANVTLKKSLGTPYSIFIDKGFRLTIDAAVDTTNTDVQTGGLYCNFGDVSIFGIEGSTPQSTQGPTPEAASTIVIKSGKAFMGFFKPNNAQLVASEDITLYAKSDGAYESANSTTTAFSALGGATWQIKWAVPSEE
jgi:hypothetical protein